MRLAGRTAIVTGTGDGQGRTAALRFVREGARVVGCDINEATAAETERLVAEQGGEYLSLAPLDLTNEGDVATLIDETVARYGGIDLVYNNAMGARAGSVADCSVEDFEFTLRGVIEIPWLVTRAALPHLSRSPAAAVVNIASVGAMIGAGMIGNAPFAGLYGVAKAAVIRLSQAMAIEFSPLGIRVNSISPGLIDTPALAPAIGPGADKRLRAWNEDQLLVRRIGTPNDIVNAGVFLLSEEASYITGINLVVDGGWVASGGVGQPDAEIMDVLGAAMAQH